MKFYRLFTTLIIFHLLTLNANVRAQEIAEYEIRKACPSTPFDVTLEEFALSDDGYVIPTNQCNDYQTLHPYMNQCGFSAGENHHVVEPEANNDIDLSPLSFHCFDSGVENEYQSSSCEFEQNHQLTSSREQLARENARKIIDSVFRKASSVEEIIEDQFSGLNEFKVDDFELGNFSREDLEYVPYVDPAIDLKVAGAQPVLRPEPDAAPNTTVKPSGQAAIVELQDLRDLAIGWQRKISQAEVLNSPVEWLNRQILELECQLCGHPVLNLYAGLVSEIEIAGQKIAKKEKELKRAETRAKLLGGLASMLRMSGRSLIDAADNMVKTSTKEIEAAQLKLRHLH